MGQSYFSVGTSELAAQSLCPNIGILLKKSFFGRRLIVRQPCKTGVLCGEGSAPGCFQKVQTFPYGNFTEPGFFIRTVKTGKVFVGWKKNLLCQVFCIERIADRTAAYGINQILILANQIFQILFLCDGISPLSFPFIYYNAPEALLTSFFRK